MAARSPITLHRRHSARHRRRTNSSAVQPGLCRPSRHPPPDVISTEP
jgi:hypothetical protein